MTRAARLRPEERQLIRDLRTKSGWSAQRIADVMDLSLATVHSHLAQSRPAAERVEDALWLLDAGEHPAHIARRVGFGNVAAMDRAMRRLGHVIHAVMREADYERSRLGRAA